MPGTIFIGDELTASGFRLTGIETLVPAPADVATTFAQARARAGCILITAGLAREIPAGELETALVAEAPIVSVIPDIRSKAQGDDVAARLRITLGVEI